MRSGLCSQSRAQSASRIRAFEFVWLWRQQRRADFQALVRQVASPSVRRKQSLESEKDSLVNIIVCIKQVPAKDAPLAIAGNWIKESDIGFEMNEPDSYALEEALRLKEKHGGEVIALSMGPERVKQTIKEALAKGADRGIHIADNDFAQLDPLGSAKSLAAAIQQQKHDLVLTGLQSDDHGFGQTGVLLAGVLDVPHATIIMGLKGDGQKKKMKSGVEGGWV